MWACGAGAGGVSSMRAWSYADVGMVGARRYQRLDMQRCQSAGPVFVCHTHVSPPVLPACSKTRATTHNTTRQHCVCNGSCPVLSCSVCAGVGKMMWLIDFEGYSLRNAPAVRTSLGVLHTLQVCGRVGSVCGVCVVVDTWHGVNKALEAAADAAAASGTRQACRGGIERYSRRERACVWVDC